MSSLPEGSDFLDDPLFGYKISLVTKDDVLHMDIWAQPGGGATIAHIHPHQEERFEVVEGQVTFRLGQDKRICGAGDRVTVPAGMSHAYQNTDKQPAHLLAQLDPASGMEEFFREALAIVHAAKFVKIGGLIVPKNPVTLLKMAEVCDRYRHTMAIAAPAQLAISVLARLARLRRDTLPLP